MKTKNFFRNSQSILDYFALSFIIFDLLKTYERDYEKKFITQ